MTFEDCLKQGLIKKDESVVNLVQVSMRKAQRFLSAVELNLNGEQFDMCVIASYNSIFSCNKALLYSKGFTEHSHVCLVDSIRELFKENLELVSMLNTVDDLRLTRHRIQYSGLDADFEMSEFVSVLAKDYFVLVKKTLNIN